MAKKKKDTSFSIKREKNYSFYGNITQGEIHLTGGYGIYPVPDEHRGIS